LQAVKKADILKIQGGIHMFKTEIASPIGQLTLASDGTALTGLWLKGQKYFASTLCNDAKPSQLPIFEETQAWLNAYFQNSPLPPLPQLAPKGSEFRQNVWKLLLEIPYGETRTYGMLAQILRKKGISAAAQAVGGAVGHNPILILIPCHRILGADGNLTGYAGGIEVKRRLLQLEGIPYI
jgi:methylated-DNA-[protein]-cysteine S-methyltransferase